MTQENLPSRLDSDKLHADKIASAHNIPAVRAALRELLLERCGTTLDAETVEVVVDALTVPVAYAGSVRSEQGRRYGSRSARESVARRLGLGALAPDA